MRDTRAAIIAAAEPVFDEHGFAATGVDALTAAAGVSTRTLYKHVGSKAGLVAAALEARMERFFARMGSPSIETLFSRLAAWTEAEGARGCLFLRARGEAVGDAPEVAAVADAYRTRLRGMLARVVADALGREDDVVAEQLLVLFEGAVAASSYRGSRAIAAASTCALATIAAAD